MANTGVSKIFGDVAPNFADISTNCRTNHKGDKIMDILSLGGLLRLGRNEWVFPFTVEIHSSTRLLHILDNSMVAYCVNNAC